MSSVGRRGCSFRTKDGHLCGMAAIGPEKRAEWGIDPSAPPGCLNHLRIPEERELAARAAAKAPRGEEKPVVHREPDVDYNAERYFQRLDDWLEQRLRSGTRIPGLPDDRDVVSVAEGAFVLAGATRLPVEWLVGRFYEWWVKERLFKIEPARLRQEIAEVQASFVRDSMSPESRTRNSGFEAAVRETLAAIRAE